MEVFPAQQAKMEQFLVTVANPVEFVLFKTDGLQWNLENVTRQLNARNLSSSFYAAVAQPFCVILCQDTNQMGNVRCQWFHRATDKNHRGNDSL